MVDVEGTPFCDQCGAEILLGPVVLGEIVYCCQICASGEICDCAIVPDEDTHRGEESEF